MENVIGVRFKRPGKIYFFDSGNIDVKIKDKVIVETAMGQEIGEVLVNNKNLINNKIKSTLKPIIRVATEKDLKHFEENKEKEKEAFKICEEKIKKHKLDMHLVDTAYTFDNAKLLFYFTADNRIDFRELVKELASIFKTRIELRQIGVRDQVRRIGGNGVCGRELCCCTFLNNFDTVSIKMAKEQNIALNPSKISGNCGRLMCCLRYEQEAYEEKLKRLPKVGAIVKTDDGEGTVDNVEILKEIVRVKIKDGEDTFYKKYPVSEIKIIKNIETKELDQEEKENLKELEKLEKLDEIDNAVNDEDM
jgi:cell fate regulator YaaT (PSP1 superfamily)